MIISDHLLSSFIIKIRANPDKEYKVALFCGVLILQSRYLEVLPTEEETITLLVGTTKKYAISALLTNA